MATEVLMPRQGNTVESCIILSWKKKEGDRVAGGEVLCEVETDKATFEVEAPAAGTLLARLYPEGADVPVLELIAVIGEPGEEIGALLAKKGENASRPQPPEADQATQAAARPAAGETVAAAQSAADAAAGREAREVAADGSSRRASDGPASGRAGDGTPALGSGGAPAISPRARNLASAKGLDTGGLAGTGPGGRIIERDVRQALGARPEMTAAAIAALKAGGGAPPEQGSGIGGRITAADVAAARAGGTAAGRVSAGQAPGGPPSIAGFPGPSSERPVQGIRKRIAERMLGSLQSTAQLTLAMPADARQILSYRARLKSSPPALGLAGISLNDIILFAVARSLHGFPEMNAHFLGDRIVQFERVHLGFAVDTPRGLIVPVVRAADLRSLKDISEETKRLSSACLEGSVTSDDLAGGTFTVTNLGSLGIEYFTPVLNPPQVGIVGVGAVAPRPVEVEGRQEFVPHLTLSLTMDHQAIDGAPAARFLRALAANIAAFDLLLAE